MTPLERIIKNEIAVSGPVTLGHYMGMCLGHPQHGYYMTRDPFGAQGDFITAPEVSQLFGEMIGAWLADLWVKTGRSEKIVLLEAGPGRGTLMSDIMRVAKSVPAFHDAIEIHLLEMSPVLKEKQRVSLSEYSVQWHQTLSTVPDDAPLFFVANEFLDALPFEHLQFDQGEWLQRAVGIEADNSLHVGLKEPEPSLLAYLDGLNAAPAQADILEVSPAGDTFIRELAFRMKKQTGGGLFIDYGYEKTAFGQTIQALHQHQPVSIFFKPGESDITAHVNFGHVAAQLGAMDLHATPIVTQGAFLKTLGIDIRLQKLLAQASDDQADDLRAGYQRLVLDAEMGSLFKVLGFTSDPAILPAGF